MRVLNLCVVLFALWSCSPGASNNESSSENKKDNPPTETVDMNGPIIEMNVISFSVENSKTEIEVINRSDEPLTSVSLRMVFIDENGDEITTATGRRKDAPFQTAQNPFVVDAKSKAVITARNKIEGGTGSIRIEEVKGQTKSGETIVP
ncbi:MAG: hypothetical protein JJU02_14545 [Cryomorphaceae bacterium]|nr:hypothetical protein [Cryomorphaceae bacterium]